MRQIKQTHDIFCPAGAFERTEERGRKPECQCALIHDVRLDEGDMYASMEKYFTEKGLGVLELRRATGRYT